MRARVCDQIGTEIQIEMTHDEEEKESFYIHVPSPIGLIGWNIQHMRMPKVFEVFEGVTCPSRALPPNARTVDIARSIILLLNLSLLK